MKQDTESKILEIYEKYAPKNISLQHFKQMVKQDPSLLNSCGEFSTFDLKLNQAFKSGKHDELPNIFTSAMVRFSDKFTQFSDEWVSWLEEHKELADIARNATPDNEIAAYTNLFEALSKSFCDKYGCFVSVHVITDWATALYKPDKQYWDETLGFCQPSHTIKWPKGISVSEKQRIKQHVFEQLRKDPNPAYPKQIYEHLVRESDVYINIKHVKQLFPQELFNQMLSCFAHEMHHALDFQHPNKGILGEQTIHIDRQTKEKTVSYKNSASENSSYAIQFTLLNKLRNDKN